MKYKTLDWIGRIPLCVLPWMFHAIFYPPMSLTIAIIALILVGIQFAAIGTCLYLGKPKESHEEAKG
jgi:hypothetical protein